MTLKFVKLISQLANITSLKIRRYVTIHQPNSVAKDKDKKMKCMFCKECVKVSDSFKSNPEDDGLVTVAMDSNRYTFSVESNGAMKPEDIVIRAIDIMQAKLSTLKHQCLELKQEGAP